jgi:purine nucleoside phosphorylase
MSTVPECIIARHAGLRVAAVAVVTNLAAGISDGPITLEEAIAAGQEASGRLGRVLFRMLEDEFGR